jgi:Amt family ammonium transporter
VNGNVTGLFYGDAGQLVAQLMGVATLLGFVFVMSFLFNLFIDWFVGQRVSAKSELAGLDVPEMGAVAYHDFVLKPEAVVTA